MAYKALEIFIFQSISGVFLFSQIDDHKTQRRHLLRVQLGVSDAIYYISHFAGDFLFYFIICIPSLLMVFLGYRHEELSGLSLSWLLFLELCSKISFGAILMPLIYLIGFLQRRNSDGIYKSMGIILYVIGHLFNMCVIAVIIY